MMTHSNSSSSLPKKKNISFRWKILLLILGPLLLAIISTQLILWIALQWSNESRKTKFVEASKAKIEEHLNKRKKEVENLVSINQSALLRKDFDYNNLSSSEKYFWYQMKYNLDIDGIKYYDNENGNWISLNRNKLENFFSNYRGVETKGEFKEYALNKEGQRNKYFTIVRKGYNPRLSLWYKEAKKSSKQFDWVHSCYRCNWVTYNFKNFALDAISLYQRIINPTTKQLKGILTIDLNFSSLQQYLSDINVTQGEGRFLIMDCSSKDDSTRFSDVIAQSNVSQPHPNSQLFSSIITKAKNSVQCQEGKKESINFNIQGYDVYISPLNIGINKFKWLLIIILPENYFIKHSTWLTTSIFFGGILLIIMAVCLSLFASRKFSEPIAAITDAAAAIESEDFESLDLDKLAKIANKNDEIGSLAKVFLSMITTIYKREESFKTKLEKLQKNSIEHQSSGLAKEEYIEALIQRSRSLRCDNKEDYK